MGYLQLQNVGLSCGSLLTLLHLTSSTTEVMNIVDGDSQYLCLGYSVHNEVSLTRCSDPTLLQRTPLSPNLHETPPLFLMSSEGVSSTAVPNAHYQRHPTLLKLTRPKSSLTNVQMTWTITKTILVLWAWAMLEAQDLWRHLNTFHDNLIEAWLIINDGEHCVVNYYSFSWSELMMMMIMMMMIKNWLDVA